MIKFFIEPSLKISGRELSSITQYSTTKIEAYTTYYSTEEVLSLNLIRPDGARVPEIYFEYVGESQEGHKWEATILPFHTFNIPKNQTKGKITINFLMRYYNGEILEEIKSSPLVRIAIDKSTEPQPESIPPRITDQLWLRMDELNRLLTDYAPPFVMRGEVEFLSDLNALTPDVNDVYKVEETNDLWIWNGEKWIDLGLITGMQGPKGEATYLHVAYADSADGTVNFTLSPEGRSYIGIYRDYEEYQSTDPATYNWTLMKGADGADGTDGVDGDSAYLHIAWADSPNGQVNFSTNDPADRTYIGTYTNNKSADSLNPANYSWALIKGADGADGTDGEQGRSAYLHVAYANSPDGQVDFSITNQAEKKYIGTYTNFTAADSSNYNDYDWVRIQGADGADGTDGADGEPAYIHVAYSTSADGSENFSTTSFDGATHIGTYTDTTEADSTNYLDYSWILVRGADGADGTDGVNGEPSYIHIAYSTSADGISNFSTTAFDGAIYMGTYADNVEADSTNPSRYTWTRVRGLDGADGSDGVNGDNAYIHIAYSTSADGSADFNTEPFDGAIYIGTYSDFNQTDSALYSDYKWTRIRGLDGADGTDGTNGQDSYIHVAYATSPDGATGFSTSSFDGAVYIGTYTDFSASDSTLYSDYEWTRIRGLDGADGTDGADGLNSYLHVAYSTSSDGFENFSTNTFNDAVYIGTYTDNTQADSTLYTDYNWTRIRGLDGADGTDGANGENAYLHIAYSTSPDGSVDFSTDTFNDATYIGTYTDNTQTDSIDHLVYNWTRIRGLDGADGADGTNGENAYIHIAYATSADGATDFSTTSFDTAVYIGTYTDFSEIDSQDNTMYEWTRIRGADGADGSDGVNGSDAYLHIAYATSADGQTDFSTTAFDGALYIGTYSDSTAADSTDYTSYNWVRMRGYDGADGTDGINGEDSYIHVAYSTSADGTADFSTTVFDGAIYMGTYTDNSQTDSIDPLTYEWTRIRGVDGADGTNGDTMYLHIAYATSSDGGTGFSLTYTGVEKYIGTYTDTSESDSTVPTKYSWKLFKGEDGQDGTDGTSVVLQGSVQSISDLPTSTATIGDLYVVLDSGDGYVFNGSDWDNVGQIQGPAGEDGADGHNAYVHYAYSTSSDGTANFSTTAFEGAFYLGIYTDFISADSTDPLDYEWTLIKGADGVDGADGNDGLNAYVHYAYATDINGTTGFSLTYTGVETHVGWYSDFTAEDSTDPTKYEWGLFKGADGADGNDGENGLPAYIHYAYSTSADGSTDFSLTYTGAEEYVGWYTDFTEADSIDPLDYEWQVFKGQDGIDGNDGENGLNAYIHYAYATSSDGSQGFSLTYTGVENYVGWYSDFTETDSNTYTDYEWGLFKGADGADGADGSDGLPSYIHYAYATNNTGTEGFSLSYTGVETYVGWYTDFNEADSTDPNLYEWGLFKGADGANGEDGADGLSAYIHYAYATSSDGSTGFSLNYTGVENYVGWYTDFTEADSTNAVDYEWGLFKGADGADGSDGADGLPSYIHYAYATSSDGSTGFSLTYTGVETHVGWYTDFTEADSTDHTMYEWGLFKGADGADGADGNDGVPAYIHYAYATSDDGSTGFSLTYTGSENYVGWYTDFTEADSTDPLDYEWGLFKGQDGIDGNDGEDGLSAYIHYAYATASDGSAGFSLTYTGAEPYVGWYTDFVAEDSNNYTDYEWQVFKGQDGADGENGIPSYIHYAYATAADGSAGFTLSYTGAESYVGWYTDFTEADSNTYTDYEWQVFKGADGADGADGSDGLNAYIHYAYSTSSDGSTDFSLSYTGTETYVGWYTDFNVDDSIDYTDYEWQIFKGKDGADGENGSDGLNAYVHYAYATNSDGTENFSLTYTGTETYVGWYTDFTAGDSSTASDYDWSLFKGADGIDGLNAFIHYAYATSSDGSTGFSLSYTGSETYIGWYTDFSSTDSTEPTDYEWSRFKGLDGPAGPGLINRGLFSATKVYYYNENRRDVVQYGADYYVLSNESDSPFSGSWDLNKWEKMDYFESVATDILLANDASINKTLIIGDGTDGILRSYGMTGLNDSDGEGFYLDGNTGELKLGDVSGDNLHWDKTNLNLTGDVTATNLTLTNNANITKRLTMGTSTEKGSIASYGMSSLTDATGGFFLNGDGDFIFGDPNGKYITWNGSELEIVTEDIEIKFLKTEYYTSDAAKLYYSTTNHTNKSYYDMSIVQSGDTPDWSGGGGYLSNGSTVSDYVTKQYGIAYDIQVRTHSYGDTDYIYSDITTIHAPNPQFATYTPLTSWPETDMTIQNGGASRTFLKEGVYRVDVSIVFWIGADINNGEVITTLPADYRPEREVWGILAQNPGTDYETERTAYFEISPGGDITMDDTLNGSEEPITIQTTYFVGSNI